MCVYWAGLPSIQFKVSKEISSYFFSTSSDSFIVIPLPVLDVLLSSSGVFHILIPTLWLWSLPMAKS